MSAPAWRCTLWGLRIFFWLSALQCLFVVVITFAPPEFADQIARHVRSAVKRHTTLTYVYFGAVAVLLTIVPMVGVGLCCFTPDRSSRNDMITFVVSLVAIGVIVGLVVAYFINRAHEFRDRPRDQILEINAWTVGIAFVLVVLGMICFTAWYFFFIDLAKALDDRIAERLGWLVMLLTVLFAGLSIAANVIPAASLGVRVYTMATLQFVAGIGLNVVAVGLFPILCGKLVASLKDT